MAENKLSEKAGMNLNFEKCLIGSAVLGLFLLPLIRRKHALEEVIGAHINQSEVEIRLGIVNTSQSLWLGVKRRMIPTENATLDMT